MTVLVSEYIFTRAVPTTLTFQCTYGTGLEDLAEGSDKIVEVVTPTIAATTTSSPFLTEMEQLYAEVRQLQIL